MPRFERGKPAVQYNQTPQHGTVVSPSDQVLKNHTPDGTCINILPEFVRWVTECLNTMAERSLEPTPKRNLKPPLWSRQH